MTIEEFIEQNLPYGNFAAYTQYDCTEKTLSVYLRPEEYYVENVNDEIDVFKSLSDNQIVGCRLHLGGKFVHVQPDDFK